VYHRRSSRCVTVTNIVSRCWAAAGARNRIIVRQSCSYKTRRIHAGKVPTTAVRRYFAYEYNDNSNNNDNNDTRMCITLIFRCEARNSGRIVIVVRAVTRNNNYRHYCTPCACCWFGPRKKLRKIKQIIKHLRTKMLNKKRITVRALSDETPRGRKSGDFNGPPRNIIMHRNRWTVLYSIILKYTNLQYVIILL